MKYALTILTEQQLIVDAPPDQAPYDVVDGFVQFKRGDVLQFAIPAQRLLRCEAMPEPSPIVAPS